jgi:mannosyl-oligosaccharide alpha-1,2-mannosidase
MSSPKKISTYFDTFILRLGPEVFRFSDDIEAISGPQGNTDYLLRPEVVESYFILWRITGDPKYRQCGWEAAQAIEIFCKAGPNRGYSGLRNVYSGTAEKNDVQETFFLAETLKVSLKY